MNTNTFLWSTPLKFEKIVGGYDISASPEKANCSAFEMSPWTLRLYHLSLLLHSTDFFFFFFSLFVLTKWLKIQCNKLSRANNCNVLEWSHLFAANRIFVIRTFKCLAERRSQLTPKKLQLIQFKSKLTPELKLIVQTSRSIASHGDWIAFRIISICYPWLEGEIEQSIRSNAKQNSLNLQLCVYH